MVSRQDMQQKAIVARMKRTELTQAFHETELRQSGRLTSVSKEFGPDNLFVTRTAALYKETQELIAVQQTVRDAYVKVKGLVRKLEKIEDQVRRSGKA